MPRVPDLPGRLIDRRSDQEIWLKQLVASLCQLDNDRFPGSQPVSFGSKDLEKLEAQDYWVCEKSDGVRVLLLIYTNVETGGQEVYLIDRHNAYRELTGLYFPHHEDPRRPLLSSLIDGELVIDIDPRTKQETLRYLAFDCLVVDQQNVMSRTLDKRYGRLKAWLYAPYAKMMKDHPHMAQTQPFDLRVKDVKFSYHVEDVFAIDIPALQHGNDGLIYTCVNTPYLPGTDQNIKKWKPPTENSIDFKLVLRFPPMAGRPRDPDLLSKPMFELHVYCGDDRGIPKYEFFDTMHVEDHEWEELKASGEQLDDRVVEVHWDPEHEYWRMMRFRDDKPKGNFKSVVDNIIQSIADGVEKDTLLARSLAIRNAWKARHGQGQSGGTLPPQQPNAQLPKPPPPPTKPAPAPARPDPPFEARYGPLAPSPWSKVTGPETVAGLYR